ncbi:MAG: RHS repeat-associated core domain-containing protein, partial [Chloroflexota bacterium]
NMGTGDLTTSFGYDDAGNRTSVTKPVTGTTTYSYNNLDQITREDRADGSFETYTYDARGNLVQVNDLGNPLAPTAQYDWDARDRMTAANVGGNTLRYTYDHTDNRVYSDVNGTATHYLWDEFSRWKDVVLETDGTGAPTASYVVGVTGTVLSQTRNGATSYYLRDAQHSTRALTDGSGAVTDAYGFSALGELTESSGSTLNDYLYTGQQYDTESDLYSLRARYYDPGDGRFLSRDTYPYDWTNPVEFNRYGYTANSPINGYDPSGYNTKTYAAILGGLSLVAATNLVAFGSPICSAGVCNIDISGFIDQLLQGHFNGEAGDRIDNLLDRGQTTLVVSTSLLFWIMTFGLTGARDLERATDRTQDDDDDEITNVVELGAGFYGAAIRNKSIHPEWNLTATNRHNEDDTDFLQRLEQLGGPIRTEKHLLDTDKIWSSPLTVRVE